MEIWKFEENGNQMDLKWIQDAWKMKNIYDGSFIGQKHTTRPKFIESLKQSGFKIKTFGAYNKNYINWTEMINTPF